MTPLYNHLAFGATTFWPVWLLYKGVVCVDFWVSLEDSCYVILREDTKVEYLKQYVDDYNSWNTIFGAEPISIPTTPDECKSLFSRLASELSPENLTCDGERPPSEVKAQAKYLWGVWAELEEIFGREVNEDEF